jgi:hypothetical protein
MNSMKSFLTLALLLSVSAVSAQHYYKDIIGTRETAEMMRAYREAKVARVVLASYDESNTRITDFSVEQQFSPASQTLTTITRSGTGEPSLLLSHIDGNGRVIRTLDSSRFAVTTTQYSYSPSGQLLAVVSQSADSARRTVQQEEHQWQWAGDRISRMLRIKNRVDTTFVDFVYDEKGLLVEERETRRKVKGEPVYYYYDASGRLTDIVRFNQKARRLLPEYLFEYSPANQVIQKITVPSNSDQYLIWRYQYNAQGLKTKEVIYNKQKQVTGKIEYQYSFGS